MNKLTLKDSDFTPRIIFDYEKGQLDIRGKSMPDDANSFYDPLILWVEDYSKNPQPKTTVNLQFAYFNTSTSKNVLEIFKRLVTLKELGNDVVINWIYELDEEDMLEAGQDYQAIVKIPFNLIGYKR